MCGITGVINLNNQQKLPQEILSAMTDCIVHRGPDAAGFYSNQNITLGHRRLKIIDLSEAGNQPMFDGEKKVVIVFNGEIYNFQEIKKRLEAKGHAFKNHTDTEVILHSYLEYGIDCIKEFNGMFAFALHDFRNATTFLVRDRLGIKPLHFARFDSRVLFGSEIKSILKYPEFPRNPDLDSISSYLSYRYPVGGNTFFKDVKCLKAGYFLKISGDQVSEHQYWNLPKEVDTEDRGEEFYLKETRKILNSAVRYRMISDVPIGAYLSGGVDSSAIVALMAQQSSNPVKTFTIGFPEKGYNEMEYAAIVAKQYNTDHHEIMLDSDNYFNTMRHLIEYKDAPLGIPNEPALYTMSKELKKQITVVLSGEGADEIFAGYGRIFRSAYDFKRIKKLLNNNDISEFNSVLIKNLRQKYDLDSIKNPYRQIDHFIDQYQYIKWDEKKELFSTDLVAFLDNDKRVNEPFHSHFSEIENMPADARYPWIFEKLHIVGLLNRVDTTTMATSVEARVPFVDHRLVEFALRMPMHHKLRWNSEMARNEGSVLNSTQISEYLDTPKYILKKALEKDLPHEILYRKKMGFPVPLQRWFGGAFNSYLREILLDEKTRKRGIFNVDYLENALNKHTLASNTKAGIKWWMLLNLELWFRAYID